MKNEGCKNAGKCVIIGSSEVRCVRTKLAVWQLVLLMIAAPPIGAYFVCVSEDIPRWIKLASVVYCIVLLYFLLTMSTHSDAVTISATPWVSPTEV